MFSGYYGFCFFVIFVNDQCPSLGKFCNKRLEGFLNVPQGFVVIQVVSFYVGDNGDRGTVVQERPKMLVRLNDQILSFSYPAVGVTELLYLGSNDNRRIQPGSREQNADHGSCGGFTVASRYRDGGVFSCETP